MKISLTLFFSLIFAAAEAQVQVLPPDFTLFGKTSADYLVEYDQTILPFTTNGDYLLPKVVPSATEPVYFPQRIFIGVAPGVGIQTYFIPDDVYVYLPIVHFDFDNVGNAVLMTPEQLRDQVNSVVDTVTNLHVTIDGVALTNLLAYRTESPVFSIFFPTNDNILSWLLGQPVEGLDDPVVAGGYLIMLAPLPVGLHDFRTCGCIGGVNNFCFERHYQMNVFHTNHPPVADASATLGRVISRNSRNATVLLDASRSSDPGNQPLSYSWLEGGSTFATGVLATNILSVGSHAISLVVNDGALNDTNTITVEVITPCQAVSELEVMVQATQVPRKKIRSLVEELRDACAALGHGFRSGAENHREQLRKAIQELRDFQNEVSEKDTRLDQAIAALLVATAQEIIDAISQPQQHQQREEDEHGEDRE